MVAMDATISAPTMAIANALSRFFHLGAVAFTIQT
jgi:hypothetical protein